MKEFVVRMHEVYTQDVKVEAKNKKEALQKVLDGDGEYIDNSLCYNYTLDNSEDWEIEEY